MSSALNTYARRSRRTIGTPVWWAIVACLALFVIAAALVVVGVNPALDGYVIAVVVGLFMPVIPVAVTIALAVAHKLRRTAPNDDWIYW